MSKLQIATNDSESHSINGCDLLFIVDTTLPMVSFIQALQTVLPQIFYLMQLTNLFNRVSIITYRDQESFEWCDWCDRNNLEPIKEFISNLEAKGDGKPRKLKSTLFQALPQLDNLTIGISYANISSNNDSDNNVSKDELNDEMRNWFSILTKFNGKKLKFFQLVSNADHNALLFYTIIFKTIDGICINIKNCDLIVRTTIGIILNLTGIQFEYCDEIESLNLLWEINIPKFLQQNNICSNDCYFYSRPIIKPIKLLKQRIENAFREFNENKEYKSIVFDVFKDLMTDKNIMLFTYNTIFVRFWREIIDNKRNDPLTEELNCRYDKILMEKTTSEEWLNTISHIEGCYDRTEEIKEIFQNSNAIRTYYIIKRPFKKITRDDLFNLCFFYPPNLVVLILNILANIRVTRSKLENELYLPVGLPSEKTFQLLSHLICPGTMISKRLSPIMAGYAQFSGSILKREAVKYLFDMKGKWSDLNFIMKHSFELFHLLNNVCVFPMTEDENKYFSTLILVKSLIKCRNMKICIKVLNPNLINLMKIRKKCNVCSEWVSISENLNEISSTCLKYKHNNKYLDEPNEIFYLYECKSCFALYIKPDLDAESVCHFCSKNKTAPIKECIHCFKNFITFHNSSFHKNILCVKCDYLQECLMSYVYVSLKNYIIHNNGRFIGINIINPKHFFDNAEEIFNCLPNNQILTHFHLHEITDDDLKNHKLEIDGILSEVLHVNNLQKAIFSCFKGAEIKKCRICDDHYLKKELVVVCYNKYVTCIALVCKGCLKDKYSKLVPGIEFVLSKLLCSFCDQLPPHYKIKIYNEQLGNAIKNFDINSFDPLCVYGWCKECKKISKIRDISFDSSDDVISGFQCSECLLAVFKKCPTCNLLTEKIDLSNHIICKNFIGNNEVCDTHWCWECGKKSTEDDIYNHMREVHKRFTSNV